MEEDLQSETSWSNFEDIAGRVRTCQMWKRWPPVCQLPSLRTLHSFYGRASPNVMHVSTNRAGRTGQANALWVLLAKSCLRTFPWPCIGHAMMRCIVTSIDVMSLQIPRLQPKPGQRLRALAEIFPGQLWPLQTPTHLTEMHG